MVPTLLCFCFSESAATAMLLLLPVVGRASWGEGDLPLAGDGGGEPKRESSSSGAGVVMYWLGGKGVVERWDVIYDGRSVVLTWKIQLGDFLERQDLQECE